MVNPSDKRTYAHRYAYFHHLAVQVEPFFRSRDQYREASAIGIHDYIDFDGIIVLSSIIHDRFLAKPGLTRRYVEMIRLLEPDIAVTPAFSAYTDAPCFIGTNAVIQSVNAANYMRRLSLPLIGLVVGSNDDQIQLCSQAYSMLGYQDQALGCRELLMEKRLDLVCKWTAAIKEHGKSCMLLGASRPSLFGRIPLADSFSGLAWFHNANYGRKYSGFGVSNNINCDCVHCTHKDLVGHNLVFTNRVAEACQRMTMTGYACDPR
jgi:hypothetical protein